MKRTVLAVFLACLLALWGCGDPAVSSVNQIESASSMEEGSSDPEQEDHEETNMAVLKTNGSEFTIRLEDNDTAKAFKEMMPYSVTMNELNGNEKYVYLDTSLPADEYRPGRIEAGDVMLFGDSCIVVFYESFDTPYSYTKIGHIDQADDLRDALYGNTAYVEFFLKEEKAAGVFDFETKTVLLNNGIEMPVLGLGTYALEYDTCVNSVKALLKNGGRLIDTAYMYGNEDAVGEGVRQGMEEYGIKREEIFVITKIYPTQFSDPEGAIEMALKKLDLGYIDMMLLHHPGKGDVEAYKVMERYVSQGKIRCLGLSNWYIEELESFLPQVSIMPALVQNEIHPYYQEQDVVPYIQDLGIVVQCWYPLGGRGYTRELLNDETIVSIANAHGVSSAQVILRWDLQRGIIVIPGSSDPEHIKENLDLFGFALSDEEMESIKALDRGEKHDWY